MPRFARLAAKFRQVKHRSLDPASLQFRLTFQIALLSILGLGSVAAWTSWKMQQVLIATHTQQVEYIANRFPRDVELFSEMLPPAEGLQKTIDNVSVPGLAIWVKSTDGQKLLARSSGVSPELMSIADMPLKPQVYPVGDRYLILYRGIVTAQKQPLGKFYLAQDVTAEQNQLTAAIQGLAAVCILTTTLTILAIWLRIRLSLQPLQEMSQMAGSISVADLSQKRLELSQAPSEVRELAQAFDLMLLRLADAWEQQRQFISNASHELRTPLTIVLGYLHGLRRRSNNFNDYQREAIDTATAEAERTVRLLEDLLNLARADSGYARYRLERLLLNDVVEEVAQMTEKFSVGAAADRNRQIQIQVEGYITAIADLDRLKQVLINLIDNAIKYSPAGSPILLRIEQDRKHAIVRVIDRGIGISLNDQNRIFDRFYRVDESRVRQEQDRITARTGDHGLGLAIVKTLVEGMGGSISVRSKLGEGSEFAILLPAGGTN